MAKRYIEVTLGIGVDAENDLSVDSILNNLDINVEGSDVVEVNYVKNVDLTEYFLNDEDLSN